MTRNWLITCTWTLNPAFLCSRTHWKVFERKKSSNFERKGQYVSRKISPGRIIVLGICCWRLLRTFFRSDQLLSIFVDSELHVLFREQLGFILSSTAVVTLKVRSWSSPAADQSRYAFPLIARFEKLFFVDSSTSFCQHILVSQKDNRDIFRGGTSKESSK